MSLKDIIRAWRENGYSESLSEEQRALLPENPVGETLSDEELLSISGGAKLTPTLGSPCSKDVNGVGIC